MKRILTIAGSDSGGGAGIQTDLKTITVLGGYGMSVITALTAQNTVGVQAVFELPLEFIERQIDSVIEDIGVDAVKTGMLSNSAIVSLVASKIKQYRLKRVIVDPVMVAKSGDPLLKEEAQKALREDLIPLAFVVTPNLPEASVLAGFKVKNLDTMKEAAQKIYDLGAKNVLIKGGHLEGDILDLLFDGKTFYEYPAPRIPTKNTHGTGCTFASAIATELAKGGTVQTAVKKAKAFMITAIRFSLPLGKGHGPTNPYAMIANEMERFRVIHDLKMALEKLKEKKIGYLIPEVHSNLGYALPFAENSNDVAAFPGRITRFNDSIAAFSGPEFGGSRHIASIILTLMKHNANFRSVMNIRFSEEIIRTSKRVGLQVRSFDRADEPIQVKKQEGSSLEWGTQEVLKEGKIPDIIFDRGDVGKEPMVRVIGKNPDEVVRKVLKVKREMRA
ncbi:MAG: bifunctional hydroxymethylpyrimidine kinase/phosphomethylpyrimidine kinase [Desulfobacteraceae bacterium]|nr:MAG: bifunctional hydroxymethylpyrimidine kinase/phosphomethylpyrimidine kinase [Desulfobacteraceae bacterium]